MNLAKSASEMAKVNLQELNQIQLAIDAMEKNINNDVQSLGVINDGQRRPEDMVERSDNEGLL